MNSVQYLNKVKSRLDIHSDYALAKHLGVTRSGISLLMNGKSTMSDDTAIKVAGILDIHAGLIMLDMHRERAATPEQASVWNEIYKGFLSLLLPAKRTLA